MKLTRRFYRLPIRFDAARLAGEFAAFGAEQWREHPNKYAGNTSLILVSVNGADNDDVTGPMQPTARLAHCPYTQQVLAAFSTVIGRARLMRLAPGAEVNEHSDVNYYWRQRVRVHIPVVTDPGVRFHCDGEWVHMAAGEAWIFDNWRRHRVENPSAIQRIHLVFDTVGSARFWQLVAAAEQRGATPQRLDYDPGRTPELVFERHNHSLILSSAELRLALDDLAAELRAAPGNDAALVHAVCAWFEQLHADWTATWAAHGGGTDAVPAFSALQRSALDYSARLPSSLVAAGNDYPINTALSALFAIAVNPAAQATPPRPAPAPPTRVAAGEVRYDRPIFIVAAPRSGSTLLFETLATNRLLWTLGDESHRQIEGIAELHPRAQDYASNRLIAHHATPAVAQALRASFGADLRNADGVRHQELAHNQRPASVRFLEKTPKNALRIPFLRALFPDARFVYLYRNPRDNLSSLLDSWRSGRFKTYPDLPGWTGTPWSHLLVPGWRELNGKPLAEVVAAQWRISHETVLADLAALPEDAWCLVSYDALLADTVGEMQRVCRFCDIPFGPRMQELAAGPLKPSRYTLTRPDPDKWRRNAAELDIALPLVAEIAQRLETLGGQYTPRAAGAGIDYSARN